MPEYVQISVDIRDADRVIVTRESTSDEGVLSKDPRLLNTIEVLRRLLLADRLEQRDEFALLGSCLFDYLFQGAARTRIREWLGDEKASEVLRVVLKFSPTVGDLGSYPWEYLHVPADLLGSRSGFLAASEELVLSRHVRLDDDRLTTHRAPTTEKLRIFVGIASPQREELPRFATNGGNQATGSLPNLSDQTTELLEQLRQMNADVEVEKELTLDKLSNALRREDDAFRPHVVHLVAHGTYVDQVGWLALCGGDRPGMAAWTRDTDLADCFGHVPNVVFLHACDGGVSDQIRGFRGVALQLVRRGVPAVVAMNFEIDAGTAARFASAFYVALAKGDPIDRAVQLGRRLIGTGGTKGGNFRGRAFGCPVAFVQSPDAAILPMPDEPEESSTTTRDAAVSAVELLCPQCSLALFPTMRLCRRCKLRVEPCPNCPKLRGENEPCPWCGYQPTEVTGRAPASTASTPQGQVAGAWQLATLPVAVDSGVDVVGAPSPGATDG